MDQGAGPSTVAMASGEIVAMSTSPQEKVKASDDSPDQLLQIPDATAIWEEEEATHTELTVEQDERLERFAAQLAQVEGATTEGLEFAVRVEQLIPDYRALYGEWLAADLPNRRSRTQALCP